MTQQQQQTTTRTITRDQEPAPSKDAALLNQMLDREVEYTPFMAKESIKLSARLVLRFLCTPTRSGQVCSERDAMKFIMLCKARGLNPWEGDAYVTGFDSKDGPQFSLITAHQAFLKRAEVHPDYDGMDSGVIVKDASGAVIDRDGDLVLDDDTALIGGWATIHFKTRKHPMRKRLKLSTFNKQRARWNEDPAGMIVKCAEADALRSAFPNSLGGMYLDGEMAHIEAETRDVKPAAPPTGRANLRPERNGAGAHKPAEPILHEEAHQESTTVTHAVTSQEHEQTQEREPGSDEAGVGETDNGGEMSLQDRTGIAFDEADTLASQSRIYRNALASPEFAAMSSIDKQDFLAWLDKRHAKAKGDLKSSRATKQEVLQ